MQICKFQKVRPDVHMHFGYVRCLPAHEAEAQNHERQGDDVQCGSNGTTELIVHLS